MKLASRSLSIAILSAVSGILLCSGCQESPTPQATAARQKATPEESFNFIAKFIAQSVQTGAGGMPGGFIERDPDGHSRLVIKNDVKSEIIKPKKEGDPYRGLITVTSETDYSIQRIAGSDEEKELDEPVDEEDSQEDWRYNSETKILDDDLVKRSNTTESRRSETEAAEDLVARRSDKSVRTYSLEYENNRWVLKTPLDPENEQSIENAFNHILSLQP